MKCKQSVFYLFVFFVLSLGVGLAQNPKKRVNSAADLPRFSYDVPEKLMDLLTDDAAYRSFAAKVRADLEGVLREYEIEDKTTVKGLQMTLAELDFQENRLNSALERHRIVTELEEKPEFKYLPYFFDSNIIAKAQRQSGAVSGEIFLRALRQVLAETLNTFPDSVFSDVKGFAAGYDFYNEKFVTGMLESQLAPIAKKNGNKLFNDDAHRIIGLRTMHQYVLPVVAEFSKGFGNYIASHKPEEKINIWTSRTVNLDGNQKLSPVIVAVWDTGVDPTVYPKQMFVNHREKANGKDNDGNGFAGDLNGIGFDVDGKYTSESLLFVNEGDRKKYPEWIKERQVFAKLQDGIDDDETRALKNKFQSEEFGEANRVHSLFAHYIHGTEVGSIVLEGNPAARILSARTTWRDNSGNADSIFINEAWAGRFASNIKAFVAYFKKQNVRVVTMSWSMTRKEFGAAFERFEPNRDPAERKKAADAAYQIVRKAMTDAFSSAPEILFTCSAGNTDSNALFNETLPNSLGLPNLLAIGAVDERGAATGFTSFGTNVTLYAQGLNVPALIPGGERIMFGGTSAATPQVANLAGKLFALDPKLTVAEVVKLIQDGADTSEADKRLKLINPKRSVELLASVRTTQSVKRK